MDEGSTNFQLTRQLIMILYEKLCQLRQKKITKIISDEIILCEEKLLKLLIQNYNFQISCQEEIDDMLLTTGSLCYYIHFAEHIRKQLKSSKLTITELLKYSTEQIAQLFPYNTDRDINTKKIIYAFEILKFYNENFKKSNSGLECSIKLPNNYLETDQIFSNNVHGERKVQTKTQVKPKLLKKSQRIYSKQFEQSINIPENENSADTGLNIPTFSCSLNEKTHRFIKRRLPILENCFYCKTPVFQGVFCKDCGKKFHHKCSLKNTGICKSDNKDLSEKMQEDNNDPILLGSASCNPFTKWNKNTSKSLSVADNNHPISSQRVSMNSNILASASLMSQDVIKKGHIINGGASPSNSSKGSTPSSLIEIKGNHSSENSSRFQKFISSLKINYKKNKKNHTISGDESHSMFKNDQSNKPDSNRSSIFSFTPKGNTPVNELLNTSTNTAPPTAHHSQLESTPMKLKKNRPSNEIRPLTLNSPLINVYNSDQNLTKQYQPTDVKDADSSTTIFTNGTPPSIQNIGGSSLEIQDRNPLPDMSSPYSKSSNQIQNISSLPKSSLTIDNHHIRLSEANVAKSNDNVSKTVNSRPTDRSSNNYMNYKRYLNKSSNVIHNSADYGRRSVPKLIQRASLLSDWLISWTDMKIGKNLYTNRFGPVYIADWHGDVFVNVMNYEKIDDNQLIQFRKKVSLFRKTRHENVALFVGACLNFPNFAIVTSYVPGDPLYYYIHESPTDFNDVTRFSIMTQIGNGLSYLHAKYINHMNLTTQNIIFTGGKIVLCDFGLVTIQNQKEYIQLRLIPRKELRIPKLWIYYQPPEILASLKAQVKNHGEEANRYLSAADVFAYGVILYEVYGGVWPRGNWPVESIIYDVCKCNSLSFKRFFPSISKIMKMCFRKFRERPNIQQIIHELEIIPKIYRLNRSPSQPSPTIINDDLG